MARTAFGTAEELEERVVRVDRTRKTVKGGRISSARVVCAVGDGRGNVGVGVGKARDVPSAIEKGMKFARQNMIRVPLDGYTIPHTVKAKVGGAVILLKPASRGTGIIAGGAVRQIVEVSGIRDILTKSLGSGNVFNRAMACFKALQDLYDPNEVAARREKSVEELLGREIVDPYEEEAKAEEEEAAEEEEEVEFEEALLGEEEPEEEEAEGEAAADEDRDED
ncbi:MAG: 30S ribosomal protein S5, partial [Armatimonadota bacterium]|nr:30S ribosomal protein S5 [Armatimonadota bacterium]